MWKSLLEYIKALGWFSWIVLLDVISGVTGAILDVSGTKFPTIIWVILLAVGLPIASFFAIHKVRIQRDTELNKGQFFLPKLQVTPSDILDDRKDLTTMLIYVSNCSDFVAKGISIDVRFGNSMWKRELRKASSIDLNNRLFAGNDTPVLADPLSGTSEQNKTLNKSLDHPLIDELKPGLKIKVYMFDEDKGWLSKQETYLAKDGKITPIEPEESPSYQMSQGWKEQINNIESGKPIPLHLRTTWENEQAKPFQQIVEYQLVCTKIGTGKSYTFIPTGNITEDR